MHRLLGEHFEELLAAWRHHHDVRRLGGTWEQRVAARARLDAARETTYRLRRSLAPRADERLNAALTVVCEILEAPVAVSWQDVRRTDAGFEYRCACGHLAVADAPVHHSGS